MHRLPVNVQWIVAACIAVAAFYTIGQIPVPLLPSYQPEIFGVRDWAMATFSAGIFGEMFVPSNHRRAAISVFCGAPIVAICVCLLYKSSYRALQSSDVRAVAGTLIGALMAAWLTRTSGRIPR